MRFPGGKGGCFRHIVNAMPPHAVYIETYLGGGNVLERKRPAARNIGVDVDAGVIAKWRDRISALPFPLELHHGDAAIFLRSFPFTGNELVYADPPYLHATRRDLALYPHEYTDTQHAELLEVLVSLPCAVMVSGYASSLYMTMLQHRHGWRCIEFSSMTRRGLATESLWMNFPPVERVHDHRWVGDDYRARERIRRKANRWAANFAAMPPLERQAVMAALLEVQDADGQGGAGDGASGPPAPSVDDSETGPAALGEDYAYYFHPEPDTGTTTVRYDDGGADGHRQI